MSRWEFVLAGCRRIPYFGIGIMEYLPDPAPSLKWHRLTKGIAAGG
jgi:UDP:flavonoid glycosyltransferase YjiC (YdhE family)